MVTQIAQNLLPEAQVELANHSEFCCNPKWVAEYVVFHAVREGYAFIPKERQIPKIINKLSKILIKTSPKLK